MSVLLDRVLAISFSNREFEKPWSACLQLLCAEPPVSSKSCMEASGVSLCGKVDKEVVEE